MSWESFTRDIPDIPPTLRHSRHSTDSWAFQAFHRDSDIPEIDTWAFQAFHRHSRHFTDIPGIPRSDIPDIPQTLKHSTDTQTDTQTFHRHSLRHSTDTQTFQAFHKHSDFTGIPHSDILHIPQSLRHSTHSTMNQTVTKQIYYFHSESFNCHFVSFAIGAYHKNVHTFCIIPLKLVFSLFSVFFLPFVCLGLWYTIFLTACMALLILFMWLHLLFFSFFLLFKFLWHPAWPNHVMIWTSVALAQHNWWANNWSLVRWYPSSWNDCTMSAAARKGSSVRSVKGQGHFGCNLSVHPFWFTAVVDS